MSFKLITVESLKTFAEIRDTHTDALLSIIVDTMSARIQTYLNRNLEHAQYTEYYEAGSGRRKWYLSAYPITVDSTHTFVLTDNGSTLTKDSDFYLREDEGLLEIDMSPIFIVPKQIKVVYYGGYEVIDDSTSINDGALDIPEDMRLAVYLQCSYMFKRRNDLGLTAISISGGFSVAKMPPVELLPDVKSMLRYFRRVPGMY
jgi:hypothetical protein